MSKIDTNSEEHRRACEARTVLKWTPEHRQSYYEGVKKHRGQKGVDYLAAEVKRQLGLEAQNALKMADKDRQTYYQGVLKERGTYGITELLTEVKLQRRLERSKEISI